MDSPWKPAWTPKRVEDTEVSENEAKRRVAQHVQEAKIALEQDKKEMKEAAKITLENETTS
jgi:hypothetical protein